MADRITEERLRELSQGATIYGHERNAIAAELLAARARIAKLEQEPPMALVDFGVGVNWKGLHEDMQRLRTERDALRAQLREVAASGVEAKCRQYVTVQIDPETWRKIQEVARG